MATSEPKLDLLTEEMREAARAVFDGWYGDDGQRIDWEDFIDRMENYDLDMGDSMVSPLVEQVKAYVRWYRKQGD